MILNNTYYGYYYDKIYADDLKYENNILKYTGDNINNKITEYVNIEGKGIFGLFTNESDIKILDKDKVKSHITDNIKINVEIHNDKLFIYMLMMNMLIRLI